jgi:hypothetical protein
MFLEVEWCLGIGLYIKQVDQELESVIAFDEEENEEPALLHFSGICIYLPFIRIRLGEAEIVTKDS